MQAFWNKHKTNDLEILTLKTFERKQIAGPGLGGKQMPHRQHDRQQRDTT